MLIVRVLNIRGVQFFLDFVNIYTYPQRLMPKLVYFDMLRYKCMWVVIYLQIFGAFLTLFNMIKHEIQPHESNVYCASYRQG